MSTDYKPQGDKIREARIAAGFTQLGAATHLWITASAVSGHELGRNMPPADTLCMYADLYDVSMVVFYTPRASRPPSPGKAS